MIASGEAPVRSKAGALLSPAALVISSFIMHSCPTQKDMTRSSTVCFLPVLDDSFSVLPFSKLSRLREAPTVRSPQCDWPRDGGQKSALETVDAHRDRKSSDDTGEIPAETASLESPTKRAVWEDWMVGATGIEPVTPSMSTRGSPAELRALRLRGDGFGPYIGSKAGRQGRLGGSRQGPGQGAEA